jgi:glycosyltransferase involved in cell wall biosynthesis
MISATTNYRSKILLVAMADSVHVARWLRGSLEQTNLDIYLIPTSPHRRIHPQIKALLDEHISSGSKVRIHPLLRFISIFVWILDRPFLFRDRIRALFIAKSIRSYNPDLVHIMETQNGGYPYLVSSNKSASHKWSGEHRVALTLFGSDLYWFSRFAYHSERLKSLLPLIDVLAAECERDVALAQSLGFQGKVAPFAPVSGGLDGDEIAGNQNLEHFLRRNVIAVKGYGGAWGLGHLAIKALGELPDLLKGIRVVIFSGERKAKRAAKKYLEPAAIHYEIHPKFALKHSEMLELYKSSLLYVGLSKSDGLPASMLEAMSQGAYPVQTSSACIDGWFLPDAGGTVVPVENVGSVGASLQALLSDKTILHRAQESNLATIRARYSKQTGIAQVTYADLLA